LLGIDEGDALLGEMDGETEGKVLLGATDGEEVGDVEGSGLGAPGTPTASQAACTFSLYFPP
jgi:hypothetical protein